MGFRRYEVHFAKLICDLCEEQGPRVETPHRGPAFDAATAAGWWHDTLKPHNDFALCPDCRAKVAPRSTTSSHSSTEASKTS